MAFEEAWVSGWGIQDAADATNDSTRLNAAARGLRLRARQYAISLFFFLFLYSLYIIISIVIIVSTIY